VKKVLCSRRDYKKLHGKKLHGQAIGVHLPFLLPHVGVAHNYVMVYRNQEQPEYRVHLRIIFIFFKSVPFKRFVQP
jgi:hypothetical protein